MKEGWEYKKLGEVGQIITGSTPSTKDVDNYSSNDYCFIKPSDIEAEGISKIYNSEFYISNKAYRNSRKLPVGAVLTTCIGIIGKVGILQINATCNQQINAIIPQNIIKSKFLAYAIKGSGAYLNQIANSPVVPIINKKAFSEVIIPVPPLSVQKPIVEELDLLSGIIEKQKQQLKELNTLAQSIFYDMFGDPVTNEKGWEEILIKDLCPPKKEIKRANKTFNGTDQISYVDISAIDNQQNKIVKPSSFTFKDAPSRAQQVIIKGDIIISLVRPNLNNVALVEADSDNLVASSGFCVLRCKDRINPQFIYNIATKPHFTDYLVKRVAGANYPAVREDDVMSFRTILPPLHLQNLFAEKIEAIEKQKENIAKSIEETQKLFNYTMDKYFS